MGLTDLFKRDRSSVVLRPRSFSLAITGYGIEATPRLPATIAHLADGTLVFGPYDAVSARASGEIKNVLIRPGTPPTGVMEPRAISGNSIVTYSTAQRGSTQLVLGTGMQTYEGVLETFRAMPHGGGWRLVADNHEIVWPAGLMLRGTGNLSDENGPYELALDGSRTNLINLYGPLGGDKIPAPEQLNAAGQTRIDADSIPGAVKPVKHYTFEGDATVQRYYYAHLDASVIYLIRARATTEAAKTVLAAADAITRSLRPRF
ncbi:MAG: hypothetical protein SFX73_26730 [Kofleriaceae bacterium]|nr:hypothetical protein [Kofleriaceae bacterium]